MSMSSSFCLKTPPIEHSELGIQTSYVSRWGKTSGLCHMQIMPHGLYGVTQMHIVLIKCHFAKVQSCIYMCVCMVCIHT